MTTRRGEPIETERQSVENILRPLAEAKVECPLCHGEGARVVTLQSGVAGLACPPRILDPRFEALHLFGAPYLVDTSLGAIVRAAAACGRSEMQHVLAALLQWCDASQWDGSLLTPEEAAARALVAAWSDALLHSATGAVTKRGE